MKCPLPNSFLSNLLIFVNRAALGLYFLLAGGGKFRDGIPAFVKGASGWAKPDWLPNWFSIPYLYALPFVEVAAGGLLILGLLGRVAAGVTSLMLVSFLIALGMMHDKLPFHPNVIYLALAIWLTATGAGGLSLDAIWCRSCRIKSR